MGFYTEKMEFSTQISTIGKIVNDKLKREGNDVSDVAFFRNIEKNLDLSCTLEHADKREMLRQIWLTYEQQKKHYINWEKNLIELGLDVLRKMRTKELLMEMLYFLRIKLEEWCI